MKNMLMKDFLCLTMPPLLLLENSLYSPPCFLSEFRLNFMIVPKIGPFTFPS